jgi:hypothetical protein
MAVAHAVAQRCMRDYSCKFSRKDFTLPQLFACLVLREHQNKSYRGIEALLRDSQHWCKQIGMRRVPDHNTLCRAFHVILNLSRIGRLLDRLAQWMALDKALGAPVPSTRRCTIPITARGITNNVAATTAAAIQKRQIPGDRARPNAHPSSA